MSDPIFNAVTLNWKLTLGFIASIAVMSYGWFKIRTATGCDRFWTYGFIALTSFLIGVVGFVDCLIRALAAKGD